jgi:hypothetical protein
MSNSTTTTTAAPTNATSTTTTSSFTIPDIAGTITSTVTNTIWQTLQDWYNGSAAWYYTLGIYVFTIVASYFVIYTFVSIGKAIFGGARSVGSLLSAGVVGAGASFEPLPQIEDDEETVFAVE